MVKSLRFGRGQNNDVVISDPTVSEFHCQITLDDNGNFYISDLNSTNGTYVNGTLVQGSAWLKHTDEVKIGNTPLAWLHLFAPPAPPQSAPQTQQQPFPQAYPQPTPTPVAPRGRKKNGMGTAGFVLSLISLALCWLPVFNVILFLLGLAFSIVGVSLRNRKKGLAIAGLAISVVVLICLFFVGIAISNGHLEMNDFEDIFDY